MEKIEIDSTDMKILEILQDNSETSYTKMAKAIGISSSGVHKRVKKMMKAGVIKKFVAVVDPASIGLKLKAFVGISTSPGTCEEVITELSVRKEVLEIYEIAGEHDLFIKLIAEDTEKLNDILHEIDRIQGINSSRTLVVLKTEKETVSIA